MEYVSLTENLKFSRIIAGCMRTLDAGMDGFITKPFRVDEIMKVIAEVMK